MPSVGLIAVSVAPDGDRTTVSLKLLVEVRLLVRVGVGFYIC
jgi:hypothetical protein